MGSFRSRFRRWWLVNSAPVVWAVGGGWGNRIQWWNYPKKKGDPFRVVGWMPRIPKVGDLLHSQMQSGKTLELVFTKIENEADPSDMFWGTLCPLRYLPENGEGKCRLK